RAGATERGDVAVKQLATPHGPVEPVPGAVEDRADRRSGLSVLGQARGEVGVVVLDPDQLDPVKVERVLGRQVLGVEVVGDDLGLDREQPTEMRDALGERAQRLVVLEVADVVADPRAGPARQAERVLELGAAREDRASRAVAGQGERSRYVPARPTEDRASADD